VTSLREQLAHKRAHSTSLTFPLGEAGERAKAELEAAHTGLEYARLINSKTPNADVIKRAQQRLTKAEREYAKPENSLTIRFRGLTEDERDALISAHPVTDEQKAKDEADEVPKEERSQINRAGFTPAALAVCALDSDLTEEEWVAELASDRWTAGEKLALYRAIVSATDQEPAPGVGKGFATTR
jgi:hypothetical protein